MTYRWRVAAVDLEPSVHSCCCWYCDIIKAGTWRVLQRPSSVLRLWLPWWVQRSLPPSLPPHLLEGLHRRWLPDRDELGLTSQTDLFLLRGRLQKAPFVAGQNIAIFHYKRKYSLYSFLLFSSYWWPVCPENIHGRLDSMCSLLYKLIS